MREFPGFMRGVDLGGWLSQCDYTKKHLDTFIKEDDIERIRSWGADHVRLPFDFNIILDDDLKVRADAFTYLDRAVEWTSNRNMNIVLDLHKTPGFSFDKGERESGFFDDVKYQNIFIEMWQELAKHFAALEDTVAFEILNEITEDKYAEPWNRIARRCVEEIRKIAPMNYILIGGIHNNSIDGLPLLEKPFDDRIVYNFHCYEPGLFTHQKAYWVDGMPSDLEISYPGTVDEYVEKSKVLPCGGGWFIEEIRRSAAKGFRNIDISFLDDLLSQAVAIANERNVPLYCGEYGVIEVAPLPDTVRWHKDMHDLFEKYSIGRAVWCYKGKDFGFIDDERKDICGELTKLI